MVDRDLRFTESSLTFMIACTVLNRYDFYVIIDGLRGIGKSSTAYRLAKELSYFFRKLYRGDTELMMEVYKVLKVKRKDLTFNDFVLYLLKLKSKGAYLFYPKQDLIYDQQSAKEFLQGWNSIAVFDEFINIGYSRDFFDRGQKNLIKLINLNRDHAHVIFACVPHFATIDNQLRNLSKMRIYIKERGLAIVMQPNKGITLRDKWDMDVNEKIERKWLEKNIKNPKWSKLTTYRGLLYTRPLTLLDEEKYQNIKTDKRNTIIESQMNVQTPQEKRKGQYDNLLNRLVNNEIKSFDEIDGLARGMDIKPSTLKNRLKTSLKDMNKVSKLDTYFFNKEKAIENIKRQKMNKIDSVKKIDLNEGVEDILGI